MGTDCFYAQLQLIKSKVLLTAEFKDFLPVETRAGGALYEIYTELPAVFFLVTKLGDIE